MDDLGNTLTQELNRREAALDSRSQEHAATEERLERRHFEQRHRERALDKRSRVNDAREANIMGDTHSGRGENEQVWYLERREVDLYQRTDEVHAMKKTLSRELKALAERKEAQEDEPLKFLYKTVLLQEMPVAVKLRAQKQGRREFERRMKPIRDLKAMKREMQATEEMRKREFEKALGGIQDQESALAVQQAVTDSQKEALMIERRDTMEQWQTNQKDGSHLKEAQASLEKEKGILNESKTRSNKIADELKEVKADFNRWKKSVHWMEVHLIREDRRLEIKETAITARLADIEAKEKGMQDLQKKVAEGINQLKKLDRR
ncbi:MAG: hypothetical protein Q9212_003516 [Teloschistes hypoglaucus]